jgi:hypothetical protein
MAGRVRCREAMTQLTTKHRFELRD